jgi:hypothetical protein
VFCIWSMFTIPCARTFYVTNGVTGRGTNMAAAGVFVIVFLQYSMHLSACVAICTDLVQ